MQRNHTICGLSRAMVLVESSEKGGTFAAGKAALALGCPLFVVEHPDPALSASGNLYFLSRGAVPLRRKKSGEPDIQDVLQAAVVASSAAHPTGPQSDLFNDAH